MSFYKHYTTILRILSLILIVIGYYENNAPRMILWSTLLILSYVAERD